MRKTPVVVFVVFYMAIVALLVQGCVDESDGSSGSGSSQTYADGSTCGRSTGQSGLPQHMDSAQETSAKQDELAEQALHDISEAQVDQRTQDLKAAFRQMNDICAKVVETRDALLSTQYTTNQKRQTTTGKDMSHGL